MSDINVGCFLIDSMGSKQITGVGFEPDSVIFYAHAHVTGTDVDETGSRNQDAADCYWGGMRGVAYNGDSITQQFTHSGGSGHSINACSHYSNSYCIGLRYANTNGGKLGVTTASLTSFNLDGFTINVDNNHDDVLVLYKVYKKTTSAGVNKTFRVRFG